MSDWGTVPDVKPWQKEKNEISDQPNVTVLPMAVFEGLFGSVRDRYYIERHRERWERKYGRAYPKGQLATWDGITIYEHGLTDHSGGEENA